MKKYVSSTPESMITGTGVMAFHVAFSRDDFAAILAAHNLTEIDPEAWYPHQVALNIQKAIKESDNGSELLVDVGLAAVETAIMPPMENLDDVFNGFSIGYKMNYKNEAPEDRLYVRKLSDNHYQVINGSPNSDELVYGFVYGLVKRFAPKSRQPRVSFDPSTPIDGDEDTIINVELR